jgi:hypothetical protein
MKGYILDSTNNPDPISQWLGRTFYKANTTTGNLSVVDGFPLMKHPATSEVVAKCYLTNTSGFPANVANYVNDPYNGSVTQSQVPSQGTILSGTVTGGIPVNHQLNNAWGKGFTLTIKFSTTGNTDFPQVKLMVYDAGNTTDSGISVTGVAGPADQTLTFQVYPGLTAGVSGTLTKFDALVGRVFTLQVTANGATDEFTYQGLLTIL